MPDPPIEYILEHWLTTAQTAQITGLDQRTVARYCKIGTKLNARQIGGRWFVDPASAQTFQKTRRGRKRED